jgi:hypothetical protein
MSTPTPNQVPFVNNLPIHNALRQAISELQTLMMDGNVPLDYTVTISASQVGLASHSYRDANVREMYQECIVPLLPLSTLPNPTPVGYFTPLEKLDYYHQELKQEKSLSRCLSYWFDIGRIIHQDLGQEDLKQLKRYLGFSTLYKLRDFKSKAHRVYQLYSLCGRYMIPYAKKVTPAKLMRMCVQDFQTLMDDIKTYQSICPEVVEEEIDELEPEEGENFEETPEFLQSLVALHGPPSASTTPNHCPSYLPLVPLDTMESPPWWIDYSPTSPSYSPLSSDHFNF